MNNRPQITPTALLALTLCLCAGAVSAQSERSGNADARVMQQLQQMTAENTAMKSENTQLKQALEKAQKELANTMSARNKLEQRTKALESTATRGEASGKQAEEQLERTRTQLQELIVKFRETAQNLRETETDRAAIKNQLTVKDREFKTCVDRNAGLYNLNVEVLDRMGNQGLWSSLSAREPFTKLKRVELENLIDDYKYRAEELRIERQQANTPK